jgi:hypothetical protein
MSPPTRITGAGEKDGVVVDRDRGHSEHDPPDGAATGALERPPRRLDGEGEGVLVGTGHRFAPPSGEAPERDAVALHVTDPGRGRPRTRYRRLVQPGCVHHTSRAR